ncbi:unnamed protein product [Rhizophagus irregularis]|nr:unnamed protein product [Rhizophagus irregularis]
MSIGTDVVKKNTHIGRKHTKVSGIAAGKNPSFVTTCSCQHVKKLVKISSICNIMITVCLSQFFIYTNLSIEEKR